MDNRLCYSDSALLPFWGENEANSAILRYFTILFLQSCAYCRLDSLCSQLLQPYLCELVASHNIALKHTKTIVHLRSVDPRKLCVGVKYYIVHMHSMPYYTYGSTANFLFLGPTVLVYIYIYIYIYIKKRQCNKDLRGVGNLKIDRVIR